MKNLIPQHRGPLRRLAEVIARLHRDQRGAEGLEKLLIIAAVVLPLLGVLMFFRNEIQEWVSSSWDRQRSNDEAFNDGLGGGTP